MTAAWSSQCEVLSGQIDGQMFCWGYTFISWVVALPQKIVQRRAPGWPSLLSL